MKKTSWPAVALLALLGTSIAHAQTSTSTTLQTSASTYIAMCGPAATLTATVTGANPGGRVTFNAVGLGALADPVPVVGGKAVLVMDPVPPQYGTVSLQAVYSGDANNASSSSANVSVTITKLAPTLTLRSSQPAYIGLPLKLTARVAGCGASGSVTIKSGSTVLGSPNLSFVANGSEASLDVTLTGFSHSLTASYPGGTYDLPASGSLDLQLTVAQPVSPTPVVNYEYDAEGNSTKTVAAPGLAGLDLPTTHAYDALGRRKSTTDARNGVTRFGRDGQDRLTQVIDPRSLITQYQLNGLGDQTGLISPDTGTATATYDAAGNVKTRTDARGFISSYSHDELSRLTKIAIKSPIDASQREVTFTYDLNDARHGYGIGRLTRTRTPEASTDYLYDAHGRILNVGTWFNADSTYYIAHFSYDAAGKTTHVTYPSGRIVEYTRSGGQITGVSLQANAGSARQTLLSQIQTSPFGPIRSWQWQQTAGLKPHQRVFDANGRLLRYPLGSVVRDLSYDAADRITAYTHYAAASGAAQPALNQTFGYDELGRLKTASQGSQSWAYAYDATGNRTSASTSGNSRSYTIASTSNRVSSISNPARALAYDAAGNTVSDGNGGSAYTAVYNHEGRLAQLTSATGTVMKLGYNAQGQRVKKQIGSQPAVYYAYDLQGQLLGEYTLNGTQYKPVMEYIWLEDQPVAAVRPTPGAPANAGNSAQEVFYLHTDHLGTPRVALDSAGRVRWRWMGGEPFGVNPAENNPEGLGELNLSLRLPGQQYDGFVGLHYNYFRDYDPTVGRYTQSDPIGLEGGINTYAYVNGAPTMYTDPMGLQTSLQWCYQSPANAATCNEAGMTPKPIVLPPPIVFPDDCDDQCRKAVVDASNAYWILTSKRMPQYESGGTQGRDPGHAKAIKELQVALQKAINRVRRHCKVLPAQLPEWERAANTPLPG